MRDGKKGENLVVDFKKNGRYASDRGRRARVKDFCSCSADTAPSSSLSRASSTFVQASLLAYLSSRLSNQSFSTWRIGASRDSTYVSTSDLEAISLAEEFLPVPMS